MSTLKNTLLIVLLAMTATMLCGGCSQSVPQKKKFTMTNPFYRDRPQRAARMTCIWEPKMLAEKQGVIRGFQGEIIFFRDEKMQDSTVVDGELTVYVYDAEDRTIVDVGGGVEGIRPLCEYKFNSEQLAKGMEKNKKTKMISYGVWLPIDKMPGDEKHLVLWAKFEGSGKHGEVLGTDVGDQITVYLPGNPVERKKQAMQPVPESYGGIRHAAWNERTDSGGVQQAAYAEAFQAMQHRNQSNDTRNSSDAIPMSPGLAQQLFNARQQEHADNSAAWASAATGTAANGVPSRDANTRRSAGIGFGGGDTPEPYASAQPNPAMSKDTPPLYLARNRQNITSIGAQIDQRMQNGFSSVVQDQNYGGIQQVSYAQPQSQPNNTESPKRTEIRQEMTRIMAEQEQRRRLQNQPVNAQGFTEYNSQSFATDQNRITVPNSTWGVPSQAPLQGYPQQQNSYPGQPQGYSAQNRYPAQTQGTSQFASAQSDWGPGLESLPSGRETQVIYSPPPANRIYR